MKKLEINDDFFEYVKNNSASDTTRLGLSDHDKELGFPLKLALIQIEARRKTSHKLSRFNKCDRFFYPSLLSAEQSTHQAVAAYHSSLCGSGKNILDMTAGLGIDAFTLALHGNRVTAIELETERFEALCHNREVLYNNCLDNERRGLEEMEMINGNSIEWLRQDESAKRHFDVIFIDPARRGLDKHNRTYFLSDCVPDVTHDFNLFGDRADRIMIKASPILDISSAIREIPDVNEIHLVCVKGECKEVLIISEPSSNANQKDLSAKIIVTDLCDSEGLEVISRWETHKNNLPGSTPIAEAGDFKPGSFIYDPNAGIHKANASKMLCESFKGLKKFAANTDLYISDRRYPEFPGRIFRLEKIMSKKDMKSLNGARCETISRNYPVSASELKQKYRLKGDDFRFIIACRITSANTTVLIEALRICNKKGARKQRTPSI